MGRWIREEEEAESKREVETLGSARCGRAHFNPGTQEAEVGRSL